MSEESLKSLSVDNLIDMMMEKVNELVTMHKKDTHSNAFKEKQKEIEILQKVITAKTGAKQLAKN